MHRREFLSAAVPAAGLVALAPVPWAAARAASGDCRLTGPYTRQTLALYLIHREGRRAGAVPMTLGEAMTMGALRVFETGKVSLLVVRNRSDRDVFIQAGDIVKGGKQDRVLTVSMIVPPDSGYMPIGAFCVEQGRWARRGTEKVAQFSASTARLPSKAGKIALMARADRPSSGRGNRPLSGSLAPVRRGPDSYRQGQVWGTVRKIQERLSSYMNRDIADRRSRSSLQLSLENGSLASALTDFETALGGLPEKHPDAVGYLFAVNGGLNSGDEFESAGLFRKLWRRQLRAAATEALATAAQRSNEPPTRAQVAAFIDKAAGAPAVSNPMPGGMVLITRETAESLCTEVLRGNGRWFHRSFISIG